MAYFLDSSALAQRYIAEAGAGWVQAPADAAAANAIYVARITLLELVSAIARRRKGCDLTPDAASIALSIIRADFPSAYKVIEITSVLVIRAERLADQHVLRGYDAVQLAAALQVREAYAAIGEPGPIVVSADLDLNAAAAAEGLAIDNPNSH